MTVTSAEPAGQLVVVSGMSGAGRSAAADVLEDIGWFVIDNLPPGVLPSTLQYMRASGNREDRIAVVVDVRGGQYFADLSGALGELASSGWHVQLLFLEASDEILIRRGWSRRALHTVTRANRPHVHRAASKVFHTSWRAAISRARRYRPAQRSVGSKSYISLSYSARSALEGG